MDAVWRQNQELWGRLVWKERILQRILIFISKWGKKKRVKVKVKYKRKYCPWKPLRQEIKALAKKMEIEDISLLEDNLIGWYHIYKWTPVVKFTDHRSQLRKNIYSCFKLCSCLPLNQISAFHPSLRISTQAQTFNGSGSSTVVFFPYDN